MTAPRDLHIIGKPSKVLPHDSESADLPLRSLSRLIRNILVVVYTHAILTFLSILALLVDFLLSNTVVYNLTPASLLRRKGKLVLNELALEDLKGLEDLENLQNDVYTRDYVANLDPTNLYIDEDELVHNEESILIPEELHCTAAQESILKQQQASESTSTLATTNNSESEAKLEAVEVQKLDPLIIHPNEFLGSCALSEDEEREVGI